MGCGYHEFMTATRSQYGFTMIETLVSSALLLMFFASVAAIYDVVMNSVGQARLRTTAVALASQKVETIRNLTYLDIGTVGGIPAGVLPQNEIINIGGLDFTINTTIVYIDDPYDGLAPSDPIPTDYKRVRVRVTWGGVFKSKTPVFMVTDIVPDGLESNDGGGSLMVQVINSTGEPVPDATVTIVNSSVAPPIDLNISTNADGRVLLPGAPACSDCYRINISKTNFSSERTYALSEIANPLKPDVTVLEAQISSITFSIDRTANLSVTTRGSRASNFPPFAGIQFVLRGSKLLGSNEFDEPIYKYEQSHASGPGGVLTISGLEADTYEVWIPTGATIDFAGSSPVSPFALFPGINRDLTIVTQAATSNNLLVVVQDTNDQPVGSATVQIQSSLGSIATGSAGLLGAYDNGQVLFPSLSLGSFFVKVNQTGYLEATASASVAGDSKIYVLLQNEI